MITTKQTSKEYFREGKIVFYALAVSQLFFGLIAFLLVYSKTIAPPEPALQNSILIIVVLFAAGGFVGSNFVFNRKLKALKTKLELKERMADYRSALMIRYALLEAPVMLAIILYFLTCDILFLGLAALIVAYFLTLTPTRERAIKDLELSNKEQEQINDPNAVIAEISTIV